VNIDIKDMLTLSDKNSYVVVSKAKFEKHVYYYLIDKNNNENIKFCVEKAENNSLIEVEDKKLIQQLLPFFLKAASKAITKEDIKLLEEISEGI